MKMYIYHIYFTSPSKEKEEEKKEEEGFPQRVFGCQDVHLVGFSGDCNFLQPFVTFYYINT